MSPDALPGALWVLAAGERYLPADMVVRRGVPADDIVLMMREHDVLLGLRSGLSNKEIADNLSLSKVTVKHHIKSFRGKLGARNRVHAVFRTRSSISDRPGAPAASCSAGGVTAGCQGNQRFWRLSTSSVTTPGSVSVEVSPSSA